MLRTLPRLLQAMLAVLSITFLILATAGSCFVYQSKFEGPGCWRDSSWSQNRWPSEETDLHKKNKGDCTTYAPFEQDKTNKLGRLMPSLELATEDQSHWGLASVVSLSGGLCV